MARRLRTRDRSDDGRMTVVGHLKELRRRLLFGILAYGAGVVVAFIIYEPILAFLTHPLKEGSRIGGYAVESLYVGGVATAFTVRLRISLFAGLILALPVVLWQLWRFITPGLEAREKRYAVPFVVSALALFGAGTWMAFQVLTPAIGFLFQFLTPDVQPLIRIDEYLSFVTRMILAFGLAFQLPLILIFLAGVGILSSARIARWRRSALFLSFVAGAMLTPGDPLSMFFLAGPMYILYEASYVLIRFGMRK